MARTLKIDYNRGVTKRSVSRINMDIFMYKDTPGVYLNAFGDEVDLELAKEAGFPVEKHALLRKHRDAMVAAEEKIREKLDTGEQTVIETKRGYTLIDIGLDRFQVKDPEGGVVNAVPMAEGAAKILFGQLTKGKEKTETQPRVTR